VSIDEWARRFSTDTRLKQMLAAVLKVGPSRMDAVGIADWATVLRDQPNFYLETIAPARMCRRT
jgi:hypothetical protein